MDSTFVRKDFYISPPNPNASEEEWNNWLRADNRRAAVEKAKHTRKIQQSDLPDEYQGNSIRRVNGVWKQTTAVGLSGDFDSSNGGMIEPVEEAGQERLAVLQRMGFYDKKHGGTREGKRLRQAKRRRKNRKAKRKNK